MELSIYDIIKRRVVSEKSLDLFKKYGKLIFEVHKNANKIMIREAVEKIWDVKVDDVCVINCSGKNKIFSRRPFKSSDKKKAIITLKKGYKIDLPGHFETMGLQKEDASSEKEIKSEVK